MHVRVKPRRCTLRWNGFFKLSSWFYGPFKIIDHIIPVAYQLALLSHIRVHNVFHVSLLKKYIPDPRKVIQWKDVQVM